MGQALKSVGYSIDWKNSFGQFIWKNSFEDIKNHEVKNKVYWMSSRSITVVGQEMSWSKQCHGAE